MMSPDIFYSLIAEVQFFLKVKVQIVCNKY